MLTSTAGGAAHVQETSRRARIAARERTGGVRHRRILGHLVLVARQSSTPSCRCLRRQRRWRGWWRRRRGVSVAWAGLWQRAPEASSIGSSSTSSSSSMGSSALSAACLALAALTCDACSPLALLAALRLPGFGMTELLRGQTSKTRIDHARIVSAREKSADALGKAGESKAHGQCDDGHAEGTIVVRASHGVRGESLSGRIRGGFGRAVPSATVCRAQAWQSWLDAHDILRG